MTRWDANKARHRIGDDLSAIEDIYARLRVEVYHHAADKDIPGGNAMVMLGPRADVEAWGYIQLSALVGRLHPGGRWSSNRQREIERKEIERDHEIEPPLSFLAGWVDIIRNERGQKASKKRATIDREIAYLRDSIDWILATDDDGAPWWLPVEDFMHQLHRVRRALEDVLSEGERHDTGAPCLNDDCGGALLVKHWAGSVERPLSERFDTWDCPRCKRRYTADEYALAAKQAGRLYADRLTETDMLEVYRVQPATLRKWASRGHVRKRGRDHNGRTVYDVSDTLKQRDACATFK